MLEQLKRRWQANGSKLVLILATFALGGSMTGYLGRRLMNTFGIEQPLLYAILYITVITILWPMMVLVISVPLGQFSFFKIYVARIGSRIFRRNKINDGDTQP